MKKYCFVSRSCVIIAKPNESQCNRFDRVTLLPYVIPSLLQLQAAGYHLVMVSNPDALDEKHFLSADSAGLNDLMMQLLVSQGVIFTDVLVCPHTPADHGGYYQSNVGLLLDYLADPDWDRLGSVVVVDRDSDMQWANNIGIQGIKIGFDRDWREMVTQLLTQQRQATVKRKTNETDIKVSVNLDTTTPVVVNTGIGFFDHMLEQIAKHAGISLQVNTTGDLHIDEHHTVEDTALALGAALQQALGDKHGIGRYGFVLPMDESLAQVALDLSGRAFCQVDAVFPRQQVGQLATEMVPHFFSSLADSMQATLHLSVTGKNTHHMVEGLFKVFGRALRMAIRQQGRELPSTKGVL